MITHFYNCFSKNHCKNRKYKFKWQKCTVNIFSWQSAISSSETKNKMRQKDIFLYTKKSTFPKHSWLPIKEGVKKNWLFTFNDQMTQVIQRPVVSDIVIATESSEIVVLGLVWGWNERSPQLAARYERQTETTCY